MSAQAPPTPAAATPKLEEIRGPSAFGGSWQRFFNLTWTIAATDFKLTYFGSVLGYFWSLMQPLMLFGVLYVVFTEVIRFGDAVPNYAVLLLFNIVLFQFFRDATDRSVTIVVLRENLVRKMHFPRLVIPLSTVLQAVFNLLMNLIAVFIFCIASGVEPRLEWLLFPFALGVLIVFAASVGMILSVMYVRFRDVAPIWAVVGTALFYGSPVLYPIEQVPVGWRDIVLMNPIAAVLQQSRRWVIDPNAPGVNAAAGHAHWWLIPAGITISLAIIGLYVFNREAPRIAEEL